MLFSLLAQVNIERNNFQIFPTKNKYCQMKVTLRQIKTVDSQIQNYLEIYSNTASEKFTININNLYNIKQKLIEEGRIAYD